MPTWSSSTKPMPTHHSPFCSHSCVSRHNTPYSSLTGAQMALQRTLSQRAGIFSLQRGQRPPHPGVPPFPRLPPSPPPPTPPHPPHAARASVEDAESVHTESGLWAVRHDSSHVSSELSASQLLIWPRRRQTTRATTRTTRRLRQARAMKGRGPPRAHRRLRGQQAAQQQQQQRRRRRKDDVEAQDAFVVGMIYPLSRRLLPDVPPMPGLARAVEAHRSEGGVRWTHPLRSE